ncbi:hypothetical protein [Streptomyces griseosporeus]|uniref:hypothetical protein n=1 Tax=Streptomyces griseosporeus TaxID=1910 RepID=UPI003700FA75
MNATIGCATCSPDEPNRSARRSVGGLGVAGDFIPPSPVTGYRGLERAQDLSAEVR